MAGVSTRILMSMCIIVFGTVIEVRSMDNMVDSISNSTEEVFDEIHVDVSNHTKDFINETADRMMDGFDNIFVPLANLTNDFINKVSERNTSDKLKKCSIVLGGALAGAVIGPLAIGFGIPLVLCILGFTCWGIMAGSAAACCQSSSGDVPAGSCFACCQSTGAGGGHIILILSCFVGIPLGLGLGGYIAETYVHCFSDS